jgi:hypothetical protein
MYNNPLIVEKYARAEYEQRLREIDQLQLVRKARETRGPANSQKWLYLGALIVSLILGVILR